VDFVGLSVEIPNLEVFSRKLGMMKRDAGERPSWVAMMLEASADTINECSVPNIRAHRSLKFGRAAGQAFGREDPLQEPSRPLYNVHELVMEGICLVASWSSELCSMVPKQWRPNRWSLTGSG